MTKHILEIGNIVCSKMGHDTGRLYVVVEFVDDNFVLIANGKQRSIAHPKRKRIKHLNYEGDIAPDMKEKLRLKLGIEDHIVRSWLKREEK